MLERATNLIRRLFRSTPFEMLLQSRAYSLRGTTAAKVQVNEQTALRYSAVFACIRVYAETIGALPMEVFEIKKSGTRAQTWLHPIAQRLSMERGRPCDDMTSMIWQETRQGHLSSWGNSYTEITWGNNGEVLALTPRHPSLVMPYRSPSGQLMYEISDVTAGGIGDVAPSLKKRHLDSSQMLHVPGLGGNGIIGWSPIRLAMESIGIGMGQERFAATYFGNSAKPSLMVEYPGKLDDAGHKQLMEDLDHNYSGDSAHRALLLEGGLKATPISIPMNEAQFLESREFQGEEITCRWYGLPPHVVGFLKKGTIANVQEMDQFFEKHSIGPKLIRHECELNTKLFTGKDAGRFVVRCNTNALLRMNPKDRYEAHKTAILSGQITQNEARKDDDRDPIEGGDVLLRPEAIFGKSGGDPNAQPNTPPPPARDLIRFRAEPFDTDDDDDDGIDAEPVAEDVSGKALAAGQTKIDQRWLDFTQQAIDGLLQREITHATRAAGKPHEFRSKIKTFYAQHRDVVTNKLQTLNVDLAPLLDEVEHHHAELLAIAERVTPLDVQELTARWNLSHLAAVLLS